MVAAITAGGRVDGALAQAMGTSVKALAAVGGSTLLARAILAARGTGAARLVVVGGPEVRAACQSVVDDVLPAVSDGRENLRRALVAAGAEPLLLLSSDLPFVDGEELQAFLAGTGDAEAAMPLAAEADYSRAYPGAASHSVDLAGERVANGSVFYFAPNVAPRVLAAAQRLFAARKSLLKLAALLGPVLLARFALRKLRVEDVERRAQTALGVRARAVRGASPSLCYDIDTLEDYRYAVEHAQRRS